MLKDIINKLKTKKLHAEVLPYIQQYFKNHLEHQLISYWQQHVDNEYGGIYTCISNDGLNVLSTDKYIWSQGRFLWIWSRQFDLIKQGLSTLNAELFEKQCKQTLNFLLTHAFSSDNKVYFLLDRKGTAKESYKRSGLHNSIFADCFLTSGLTEYSRVFDDAAIFEKAYTLYISIWERMQQGNVPSDPYPAPKGFIPYSYNMMLIYLAYELYAHARTNISSTTLFSHIHTLLHIHFTQHHDPNANFKTIEMFPIPIENANNLHDTMLYKHFTPGHTLEAMWFCKHASEIIQLDMSEEILSATLFALEKGWDKKYGGLLRMVDATSGEKPEGPTIGASYEELIDASWDTKIWWTHAEMLYATLLFALDFKSNKMEDWFIKCFTYTMSTFPDKNNNEWIQIRKRDGSPIDQVVALPVKDPYHIIRCIQLIIQLLDKHLHIHNKTNAKEP